MISAKRHCQHEEAVHIPCYMALSTFKPAMVHQVLLILVISGFIYLWPLDQVWRAHVVKPDHGSKIQLIRCPRDYTAYVYKKVRTLGVILEYCPLHTRDVRLLYTLPVLSEGKMKSEIFISTHLQQYILWTQTIDTVVFFRLLCKDRGNFHT